jgi:glucose-1-phosphate cytidylyltransferase
MAVSKSKIPVFILAGGMGTRLSEETQARPKPMVEIGHLPILAHIMRRYYAFGFNDFVICAGYRSWDIKQFFLNYEIRVNHMELDHRRTDQQTVGVFGSNRNMERWRVRVIETGEDAMTGARVARAFDEVNRVEPIETFALTYGDGVCDVNLSEELEFHWKHGQEGTVLGVHPVARFGELELDERGDRVRRFQEKPQGHEGVINGGFFFFNSKFRKYLSSDSGCILERQPLAQLADDGELMVYRHNGFWQPMDTLRDKNYLQSLWDEGNAPWMRNL